MAATRLGLLTVCLSPQNFPEHQYPSIIGRPILRTEEKAGDIVVKDIMCGEEAAAARTMLQISYPVSSHPSTLAPLPTITPPELAL
jgi:actin-related protein 2